MDDNALIDAILASGVKIPPMPRILLDVQALADDDNAGAREYAQVIGRDPAVTGAIFRVVGSPVMGLRVKVDSLEKAITVLGLATTVAVVRSEAMHGAMHDPVLESVMHNLWRRMAAVADLVLAGVRLARLRGIREDLAYQVGLFHDCGVAVLCRRDPGYAHAFLDAQAWPDLDELDARHHSNHAVVGLMVARNWQLPHDVAEAIRHHHDGHPETLPETVLTLVVLVQFAFSLLARSAGTETREWHDVWQPHARALFGDALTVLETELLGRLG